MSTDADATERSRAAVAVSCLEWLRFQGPAIPPAPDRLPGPDRARPWAEPIPVRPEPTPPPTAPAHPLWDPWLDG